MADDEAPGGGVRVAVVIINFNGADDLDGCVRAFQQQRREDAAGRLVIAAVDIVVVDNASTDHSARVLESIVARVDQPPGVSLRVHVNGRNRGYAGGANDGIASTRGDVVVCCNPDVRPDAAYLVHAVGALLADDRRGSVQGKLVRTVTGPAGEPILDTTGHLAFATRLFRNRGEGEVDVGQHDAAGEVFGVSGALAVYRRAMLDDVAIEVADDHAPIVGAGEPEVPARAPGLTRVEVFDEDVFAFFEDVDLDWRARMRGWSAWYEPRAVALHERGGAGPRRTAFVEALNWRNRLLVLAKLEPWPPARGILGFLVTLLLKTLELLLTVPAAVPEASRVVRLARRQRAKREAVHGPATVSSRTVVAAWFHPFDYGAWVRTWWLRVTGRAPGV